MIAAALKNAAVKIARILAGGQAASIIGAT
jgi:hypothetical protein